MIRRRRSIGQRDGDSDGDCEVSGRSPPTSFWRATSSLLFPLPSTPPTVLRQSLHVAAQNASCPPSDPVAPVPRSPSLDLIGGWAADINEGPSPPPSHTPSAADSSMPIRSSRLGRSPHESSLTTAAVPPDDSNDTFHASERLESGELDAKFVKHPLTESSEDVSTPFLPVGYHHDPADASISYPRWARRWRIPGWPKYCTKSRVIHSRGARGGHGPNSTYILRRRPGALRCILYLLGATLMLLGIVQFLGIIFGGIYAFFPDQLDWVLDTWGEVGQPSEGLSHWPTDFSGDIRPVACHSHNDYWRRVPLYSAIHAGCISVEADVWLFNEELYVGHSISSLTPNRTLKSLYINPLLDILDKQNPTTQFHPQLDTPPNGVFDTAPSQTLILLIDFKTSGDALYPIVADQISGLRDRGYLTYFNGTAVVQGPITIVGTGNAPFNLLSANTTYRDIFFDAPLDQMAERASDGSVPANPFYGSNLHSPTLAGDSLPANPYTPYIEAEASPTSDIPSAPTPKTAIHYSASTDQGQGHSGNPPLNPSIYTPQNSYYASVSFSASIGFPWRSRLSAKQLELIRKQIRGAHAQGLKVRYWSLPAWPRGLRNHIWHILVREGVDVLNVDDLAGATRRDWRKGKGWWY